jgi:dienelactone hydrolase
VVRAGEIACPVQMIYPGQDRVMNIETFLRLQETLQRRSSPTMVQLYPNADHAFMHTAGAANEAADRHARPLVRAFLEATLVSAK